MFDRPTALERAFQLAQSGNVASVADIVKVLQREGYSGEQVKGPVLKRQLNALIQSRLKEDASGDEDSPGRSQER